MPWWSGLVGDLLFWKLVSCPLLTEPSSPELTPVTAFSFHSESGGYGLDCETRLFCSV